MERWRTQTTHAHAGCWMGGAGCPMARHKHKRPELNNLTGSPVARLAARMGEMGRAAGWLDGPTHHICLIGRPRPCCVRSSFITDCMGVMPMPPLRVHGGRGARRGGRIREGHAACQLLKGSGRGRPSKPPCPHAPDEQEHVVAGAKEVHHGRAVRPLEVRAHGARYGAVRLLLLRGPVQRGGGGRARQDSFFAHRHAPRRAHMQAPCRAKP